MKDSFFQKDIEHDYVIITSGARRIIRRNLNTLFGLALSSLFSKHQITETKQARAIGWLIDCSTEHHSSFRCSISKFKTMPNIPLCLSGKVIFFRNVTHWFSDAFYFGIRSAIRFNIFGCLLFYCTTFLFFNFDIKKKTFQILTSI